MEYIEDYKGVKIYKDKETGFFKTGGLSADVSSITFLKKLIDLKSK